MNQIPFKSNNRKQVNNSVFRAIFALILALIYAGTLASFPLEVFLDRENYFTYAEASDVILWHYTYDGWLTILANEPLWLLMNIGLAKIFESETVLRIIIFVPAFIISFIMVKKNIHKSVWILFFLMMPQVIKNHIIHLRQGVAISIFILGYYSNIKWLKLLLIGSAAFIHLSFFFVILLGFIKWLAENLKLNINKRIFVIFICSLLTGFLAYDVAEKMGARQAQYYGNYDIASSGLGFLFWSFILFVYLSMGRDFVRKNMIAVSFMLFYISLYFVFPGAIRVFESVLLFILLAGLELKKPQKHIFLIAIVFYTIFSYYMKWSLPWLGWSHY